MDFSEASFEGIAYFNGTYFGDSVILQKSRIYNMEFYPKCFENTKIDFKNSNFIRIKMNWDTIKKYITYDDAVYLSLVENFNKLAQFGYADDCYYEYNIRSRKPCVKDFFALVLCEYGIYNRNIFIWTFYFMLLYLAFSTIFKGYEIYSSMAEKILTWIFIPLLIVIFSKQFSR